MVDNQQRISAYVFVFGSNIIVIVFSFVYNVSSLMSSLSGKPVTSLTSPSWERNSAFATSRLELNALSIQY